MSFCDCPPPTVLDPIPSLTCPFKIDQISRIAFQFVQATPSFDGTTTLITDEADWQALLAAVDATKVILTPFLSSPVIPPSERLVTGGGDNSTVFGLPEYQGEGNVTFTAMLKGITPDIANAIAKLACQSLAQLGKARVWVYFFNRFDQIIGRADYSGVPVYNISISSRGTEGYNADDMVTLSFDLVNSPSLWDADLAIFNPTFSPLSL